MQPNDAAENDPCPRLVKSPVFIMSTVRSGSTLLRCILDTHSRIHAGHELHLSDIDVQMKEGPANVAMTTLGKSSEELKFMLWDRILHGQIERSMKELIVDKTPANLSAWEDFAKCWPAARYIFLFRHPVSVYRSLKKIADTDREETGLPEVDLDDPEHVSRIADYLRQHYEAMMRAYSNLGGIKVRYEDLISEPESVARSICSFLNVPWEPDMLDYGTVDHGPFKRFIGDWGANIESGKIQKSKSFPQPEDIPAEMVDVCKLYGYL